MVPVVGENLGGHLAEIDFTAVVSVASMLDDPVVLGVAVQCLAIKIAVDQVGILAVGTKERITNKFGILGEAVMKERVLAEAALLVLRLVETQDPAIVPLLLGIFAKGVEIHPQMENRLRVEVFDTSKPSTVGDHIVAINADNRL